MNISYEVIRKFKGDNNMSVTSLQSIAKKTYESMYALSESPSLEIIVLYNSNAKIHQIQMAHYTSFEQKHTTVSEGIGVYTGGIHTETSLEKLTDLILKSDVVDVKKVFTQLYEEISCEEIGGNLKILEVGNITKEIYDDTINDRDDIRRLDVGFNPHLVIAEMVLGKIILGSRVVIGDTTGVFTIEGSKLMIDDRCGRPVVRLGLTSEQPDVFGLHVNRYASSNCNDRTITNISGINNSRGFYIDKIRNGVTTNVFGLSQEGDLRLRVGDNNEIMLLSAEGLSLGGSTFLNSPFRVDFNGNAWMNRLVADSAVIKNSKFGNGEIDESSLTLRDGDGIFRIFPKIGMWGGKISEGAEDFDKGNFSVDMFGNLKAHNAKFYGKAGELLIDTDAGVIDLDKFDMINVGKLMAEMLEVNTILADDGYINNLTVNRLKTIGKDANVGQYIDYIDIQDNFQRYITAQVSAKEQAKDSRNRLLFWQDSEKRILTTENTGIIAYSYTLPESSMKIKREITFLGSGDAAQPVDKIGTGDGGPNDRAKMVNTKYNGGYKEEYKASNTARERSIDFRDDGITVNSENGAFRAQGKDFQFVATDGGSYKIGLSNGSVFELTSTGLKMDVQGNIDIKASGNVKINGTRIDLN